MIIIIDCGSSKTPKIADNISRFDVPNKIIGIDRISVADVEGAKGIIISGAPILLTKTDPGPFLEKLGFLKEAEIPVLGICFGHQMLGLLHGTKAFRCREDRGKQTISLLAESPLFAGIPANAVFRQDHCESIYLPDGFSHIGRSSFCELEAMEHTQKRIFGVQFHPEVSGANGRRLFQNFLRICGCDH